MKTYIYIYIYIYIYVINLLKHNGDASPGNPVLIPNNCLIALVDLNLLNLVSFIPITNSGAKYSYSKLRTSRETKYYRVVFYCRLHV
jgi:hypothetical protein